MTVLHDVNGICADGEQVKAFWFSGGSDSGIGSPRLNKWTFTTCKLIECRALGNAELRVLVRTFFPWDA